LTKKLPTNNYINNHELYKAMVEYKKQIKKLKKTNEKPPISNYIGECLMLIAQRLSNHPWFNRYSQHWKEEMISDGIENCITYLSNFDPKKSKNPFGYFTQITYFSFRRRIEKEKKQQYVRLKNLANYIDPNEAFFNNDRELYDNNQKFIDDYEKNLLTKKKKAVKVVKGVEKFQI